MSQLVPIDEVVYFDVVTHNPSTGAVADADSTPTFDVYEEATDTGLLGATNLTKRTSLTGNYRGTFTASAANGFEAGKWYMVIASATVNAIAGKAVAMHFRVAPAESSAGVPKVDVSHLGGGSQSLLDLKDFADDGYDPSTNKVQGVVLVDTTTNLTNAPSDSSGVTTLLARLTAIRGTYLDNLNNTNIANIPAFPTNFASLGINAIGHISRVVLTDTATDLTNKGNGSGFTAIPWNPAWDAEVQSECADALVAYDPPTEAEMNARTLVAVSYGTAANQATIATAIVNLETHGDSTWATATGFATPGDVPTTTDNVTAIFAKLIEAGVTFEQLCRALGAAAAGKRSNSGTLTEQYDAIGNAGTARIVPNADAAGDGTPTLTL